jgi:hypothetical protein
VGLFSTILSFMVVKSSLARMLAELVVEEELTFLEVSQKFWFFQCVQYQQLEGFHQETANVISTYKSRKLASKINIAAVCQQASVLVEFVPERFWFSGIREK